MKLKVIAARSGALTVSSHSTSPCGIFIEERQCLSQIDVGAAQHPKLWMITAKFLARACLIWPMEANLIQPSAFPLLSQALPTGRLPP